MRDAVRIVKMMVIAIVVLALAYPFLFLLEGRLVGNEAEGDLIVVDGQVVGARNIGQEFTAAGFFHGRPSAAGAGYDAMASGGSNLGPTNPQLAEEVRTRLEQFMAENPDVEAEEIPVDIVTASGSGLDPEISEGAALIQIPRISIATGIAESDLQDMVRRRLRGRWLGIFGEAGVNVLELNLDILDVIKEGR